MSLYDWKQAKALVDADVPFYALIMAAVQRADTMNAARLQEAWPDVYEETQRRYHAGGGLLPGDPGYEEMQATRKEIGLEVDP